MLGPPDLERIVNSIDVRFPKHFLVDPLFSTAAGTAPLFEGCLVRASLG